MGDLACYVQVVFTGKLYVTGRHACFHAPAEKVAFALEHDDMRSVAKLPPTRGFKAGALLSCVWVARAWHTTC